MNRTLGRGGESMAAGWRGQLLDTDFPVFPGMVGFRSFGEIWVPHVQMRNRFGHVTAGARRWEPTREAGGGNVDPVERLISLHANSRIGRQGRIRIHPETTRR